MQAFGQQDDISVLRVERVAAGALSEPVLAMR